MEQAGSGTEGHLREGTLEGTRRTRAVFRDLGFVLGGTLAGSGYDRAPLYISGVRKEHEVEPELAKKPPSLVMARGGDVWSFCSCGLGQCSYFCLCLDGTTDWSCFCLAPSWSRSSLV